jgi:hypothetical protein
VTDQPHHPPFLPGARHPRRPLPAARRALTVLSALLLSVAAMTPAASATPAPPEPPPPPPAVAVPGLPLWAVLVMLGGTIALSAATTLITLALHPTATRGPRPLPRTPARAMHQTYRQPGPPPATTPAQPSGQRHPVRDGTPPAPATGTSPGPAAPADPFPARQMPRTARQRPAPADNCRYPTSQEVIMNPTHRTRRLSVTLAGLAAAAMALPAGQGAATAVTLTPPPTPAMATVQHTPTGPTLADLQEIAKVKRDLFWTLAKRSPTR